MSEISLANQIYIELREQILNGTIASNDIINEKSLAQKYTVSKTPIREALHRLCQEGYLKSYPRKGYMVNETSNQDCSLIQQMRFYLESAAICRIIDCVSDEEIKSLYEIAAEQSAKKPKEKNPYDAVNTRFHLALAKMSGNHYIYDVLYQHVGTITRVVIKYPAMSKLQIKECHEEIVNAMLERNKEKAVNLLYEDLSSVFSFER